MTVIDDAGPGAGSGPEPGPEAGLDRGGPAAAPSDAALTESGMTLGASGEGRVLLLACGALAREILALIRLNGWDHMDLTCLPAKLHLHPERIPGEVARAVESNRGRYARIAVVYADCGTGGLLDAECARLGVERIEGPHCYSFFDGVEAFAQRQETEFRSFFLTDFLVRQFDAFVWRPMGLDRHPELRDMIFGGYESLVYLAQTEDPALDREAERCAARLGLAYERRFTGYGELSGFLAAAAAPTTGA